MNIYQIQYFESFDTIRGEWLQLEKKAVLYYFQSFLWLFQWYDSVGRKNKVSPLITMVYDNGNPVALFPFCIEKEYRIFRALAWLGGLLNDYNAPVFLRSLSPSEKRNITKEVLSCITTMRSIDFIILKRVPEFLEDGTENPLINNRSIPLCTNPIDNLFAPYMVLTEWESLYTRVSKKMRSDSARLKRRLSEMGKVEFLIAQNLEDVERITRIMIKQRAERFLEIGKDDIFEDVNYQKFYINVGLEAYKAGLLHLSWLTLNEEIIATHWSIIFDGRLYGLILSFDKKYRHIGLGRLLLEDIIHWCCDNKVKLFDFCQGGEKYKHVWTDSQMVLYRFLKPVTLKGHFYDIAYRKIRPVLKDIRQYIH